MRIHFITILRMRFPKFEENEALGVLQKVYLNPLDFLRAHGALEQFVLILGVAIEEEKILMFLKFTRKLFCCTELLQCKSYKFSRQRV